MVQSCFPFYVIQYCLQSLKMLIKGIAKDDKVVEIYQADGHV